MAAWLEVHQTLVNHRKTYALADELRVARPTAIGLCISLWSWALDAAEDGDISAFPPSAVATAAGWGKRPQTLIDALVKVGFLDREGEGRLVIHDWHDYAGRLIKKRKQDRERKRTALGVSEEPPRNIRGKSAEAARKFQRKSRGIPSEVAGNRTVPNQEEESINRSRQTG